jgi:hypothetical protein
MIEFSSALLRRAAKVCRQTDIISNQGMMDVVWTLDGILSDKVTGSVET